MSEIKRYKMEFAPGSGGWIKQTARGELVLFTDHEAAIEKLNVEIAGKGREIARLDAALAEKQQVLADAKARIEDLHSDGGGAATAAGVADADLEGIEVHINGSSDLSPEEAEILGDAMKRAYVLMKERQGTTAIKPTPYAKAFREKFPVPEFPGIEKEES